MSLTAAVLSKATHGLSTQRTCCTTGRTGAVSQHPCNKAGIVRISDCSTDGGEEEEDVQALLASTLAKDTQAQVQGEILPLNDKQR